MATIKASDVKQLRERTGAGMMECKKALVEAEGDMEKAEDIIAKSGHKKAAKKEGRTAAQGIVLTQVSSDQKTACAIEVNCETDFVAKDENFLTFCNDLIAQVMKAETSDVAKINELPMSSSASVEDARKALVAKIGENIQFRRASFVKSTDGVIGAYSHDGRIGVLIELKGDNANLAKDIAMHVAAMRPQFMTADEVPASVIAKEKEIFMARAKESGKPDNIIEKMVEGQVAKYLAEICLVGQPFVKDQDKKISQLLKESNTEVKNMVRFEVGEGIEVEPQKSFQEEVMEQARGN